MMIEFHNSYFKSNQNFKNASLKFVGLKGDWLKIKLILDVLCLLIQENGTDSFYEPTYLSLICQVFWAVQ